MERETVKDVAILGDKTGVLTKGKFKGTVVIGSDLKEANPDLLYLAFEHEQLHLSLPRKASNKLDSFMARNHRLAIWCIEIGEGQSFLSIIRKRT
jgi:hypothetical protein